MPGYGLDERDVWIRAPVGSKFFSSPRRPNRLWGLPTLLSNVFRGLFPAGKAAGAWKSPLTSNILLYNLRFSQRWLWRMLSSWVGRHGDLVWTDVSEENIASIFRVEKFASEEPAWAGGCRLSHHSKTPRFAQDLHGVTSQKTKVFKNWIRSNTLDYTVSCPRKYYLSWNIYIFNILDNTS
jgi:hypothetical protein